jgi:hypothetical protein
LRSVDDFVEKKFDAADAPRYNKRVPFVGLAFLRCFRRFGGLGNLGDLALFASPAQPPTAREPPFSFSFPRREFCFPTALVLIRYFTRFAHVVRR